MHLKFLALAAALGPLAGCYNCTMAGCSTGVSLSLAPTTPFLAGEFELIVEGDGGSSDSCAFEIDDDPDTCGEEATPCVREACPTLYYSRDEDGVVEVNALFLTTDSELTVTLLHEGIEVHVAVLEPAYETFSANGEHCGPICTFANEDLVFDLPAP